MKEPWRISAASPVSIEEAKLVSQLAARSPDLTDLSVRVLCGVMTSIFERSVHWLVTVEASSGLTCRARGKVTVMLCQSGRTVSRTLCHSAPLFDLLIGVSVDRLFRLPRSL